MSRICTSRFSRRSRTRSKSRASSRGRCDHVGEERSTAVGEPGQHRQAEQRGVGADLGVELCRRCARALRGTPARRASPQPSSSRSPTIAARPSWPAGSAAEPRRIRRSTVISGTARCSIVQTRRPLPSDPRWIAGNWNGGERAELGGRRLRSAGITCTDTGADPAQGQLRASARHDAESHARARRQATRSAARVRSGGSRRCGTGRDRGRKRPDRRETRCRHSAGPTCRRIRRRSAAAK